MYHSHVWILFKPFLVNSLFWWLGEKKTGQVQGEFATWGFRRVATNSRHTYRKFRFTYEQYLDRSLDLEPETAITSFLPSDRSIKNASAFFFRYHVVETFKCTRRFRAFQIMVDSRNRVLQGGQDLPTKTTTPGASLQTILDSEWKKRVEENGVFK